MNIMLVDRARQIKSIRCDYVRDKFVCFAMIPFSRSVLVWRYVFGACVSLSHFAFQSGLSRPAKFLHLVLKACIQWEYDSGA